MGNTHGGLSDEEIAAKGNATIAEIEARAKRHFGLDESSPSRGVIGAGEEPASWDVQGDDQEAGARLAAADAKARMKVPTPRQFS